MKISYAITVCDEHVEIQRLIEFLLRNKRREDEIVVLFDISKQCTAVEEYLRSHSINGEFAWHAAPFQGHFANWKNKLTSLCSGDYIFQIDADELITLNLFQSLPAILESNDVDVILVPRVNTVSGLTQDHITKWGWNVDAKGWVNFPDYQWRIYRNHSDIKWISKVHEVLSGYNKFSHLPADPEYALIHPKTIERQTKQNAYYDTL
jgi:glycosyltransferase involved in cell wall biosynthesis